MSPVRGRRVSLEGELVGRGQAGYQFSEDLMFQDRTGLMYLVYESWFPWLGNLLFAIRRVPELVGREVAVDGWYFRGIGPWTGLRRLRAGDGTITSFVHYAGLVSGSILAVIGAVVIAVGASL